MQELNRLQYLIIWQDHIGQLRRLVANHPAGMNTIAFEAIIKELNIYAKVSWDVAIAKGIQPPLPEKV